MMDEHNKVYTYKGILFSPERECYSDRCYATVTIHLEDVMLSERSQPQEGKYCRTSLT